MALESRSAARLGDILLREGMIAPDALMLAQAELWRTGVADLGSMPADARLVDALGAARCVRLGVVPWRKGGGVVAVATARPERFEAIRPELEAALGPVVPALTDDSGIRDALRAVRGDSLQAQAEARTPRRMSCRGDLLVRLRRWVLAGLAVLGLSAVLFPKVTLTALAAWAITMMLLFTALKLAASVAALRSRRTGGGDARLGPDRGARRGRRIGLARQGRDIPAVPAADGWQAPRPTIARMPVVSLLVPLHGERAIAPRLVARLGRLAWPRGLLDVILVVEEDDRSTRRALDDAGLPPWMRVLAVPPGGLRTKPRALNYALDHCRGGVIGILDAEDAPEPDQIHQVVRRFHARGAEVACLQGVLGYYNASENWLSRCFAVEYATWFRLMLPGLERLGLVVPLGGTTVYFRREALERVGAWDAHNVTEDADLGLRLARQGYRTELIPAETGEEATCRPLAWVRQRSRWTKGFAITYATHMRDPRALWRDLGAWRFWGVQVLFLSTLTQALLAPLLWSFWGLMLGLGHPLEGMLGMTGLVVLTGLFLGAEAINITLGIVAVSQKRGLRWLRPWVPTLHFYHPLASLAGLKALWEVIVRPVYWDKTCHGQTDGAAPPLPVFVGARSGATLPTRPPPGPAMAARDAPSRWDGPAVAARGAAVAGRGSAGGAPVGAALA
ncbi:MAG: glycosyltransferase family 2 protein [Alkalilacustris sp.]